VEDHVPTTALDQAATLTTAERDSIDKIDNIVEKSLVKGDPGVALRYCYGLRRSGMVSGLATAKLLWSVKDHWDEFATSDTFEDAVLKETGYAPSTTRKYVEMWEALFENPAIAENIKLALACKPIGSLLLLKAGAKEGQFDDQDWKEIAGAHDQQAVRAVVDRRRGGQTSAANRLVILWERDGRLRAKRGDAGHYVDVGFLPKDPESDVARDAIERIVRSAGVVER